MFRATLQMLVELARILPRVDLVHVQGFSTKNILIAATGEASADRITVYEPSTTRGKAPPSVARCVA